MKFINYLSSPFPPFFNSSVKNRINQSLTCNQWVHLDEGIN